MSRLSLLAAGCKHWHFRLQSERGHPSRSLALYRSRRQLSLPTRVLVVFNRWCGTGCHPPAELEFPHSTPDLLHGLGAPGRPDRGSSFPKDNQRIHREKL